MKMSHPLNESYPITGRFGKRESINIGGVWTLPFHYGVDWHAPQGTPIHAVAAGYVRAATWDNSGYGGGWHVVIDHDNGLSTHYLHMNKQPTRPFGSRVKRGDVIGYVGSTGLSTGAHLHFELRRNGVAVDPLPHILSNDSKNENKEEEEMKLFIIDVNDTWYLCVPTGSGKPNATVLPGNSGMGGGGAAKAGIPIVRLKSVSDLKKIANV